MPPDPFLEALAPREAAQQIGAMRVRGAAKIGRTAAAALARHAAEAGDDALRQALDEAGRLLVAARPTAVSLRNAVNLALDGLPERDPADLRAAVRERAARYIAESEAAREQIAQAFAESVRPGMTLLTHCHSSLATACLIAAHRAHAGIRVFADETRPWWQGHITSRALAAAGVDVTLIVDSAAHEVMETEGVDMVVTGADTITSDGSLYNKVGTRAVALGARAQDIPFVVAAETHKFSPYSLAGEVPLVEERDVHEVLGEAIPGVKVRNPVFDRTRADLITRYITERRALHPSEVESFISDRFGSREGWI